MLGDLAWGEGCWRIPEPSWIWGLWSSLQHKGWGIISAPWWLKLWLPESEVAKETGLGQGFPCPEKLGTYNYPFDSISLPSLKSMEHGPFRCCQAQESWQ